MASKKDIQVGTILTDWAGDECIVLSVNNLGFSIAYTSTSFSNQTHKFTTLAASPKHLLQIWKVVKASSKLSKKTLSKQDLIKLVTLSKNAALANSPEEILTSFLNNI